MQQDRRRDKYVHMVVCMNLCTDSSHSSHGFKKCRKIFLFEAPILHLKTHSKGKLPVHQAQGEKERDGDSNCDNVFSFILGRGFWGRWCLLADHRDRVYDVYDESHDVMKSQLTTFLSAFDEGSL